MLKRPQLHRPKDYHKKFPHLIREIYECIDMNSDLLLAFLDGKIFSEKVINTYFKILEKMNLVQLSKDNYQRQ